MEFLNQNKQNQRGIERFVLIIYSLISISLCVGAVQRGWESWIPLFFMVEIVTAWIIFARKYKNFKTRATYLSAFMQLTVALYAAHVDDMRAIAPTFMVLAVLVALFSITNLLFLTIASAGFIIFYHAVISGTFNNISSDVFMDLIPQIGNIIILEYVLYVWLRNRNEINSQIYSVIDALMDAEQSKDDFLSNVSHEIRTPVNTICGMSELALREHELDKIREEVYDIRDAGQNLMSLVSDILDFSQLQQGKINIEEEAYNITSTINDIINMAMAKKGERPVELIVNCDSSIPSGLLGDEKKIRRVIMNLVNNAIKFTNEGGIIINISTRKEEYGINLCITVRDTGIGMAEESMEKLFESFSQVDTRRTRKKGGVGLGLAISRALVLKMGGTITARSHLGKGSVFRVVIPQKVLDEKPIALVENREIINVVAYFNMEDFDMMAIRDEYTNLIVNLVHQLRVRCHVCRNLAELKRRCEDNTFSHIFISLEEYQEDEKYFDDIARKAKVIIVIDRQREKYLSNKDLIRLYKPFYILPVVSILNGSKGSEGGRQMVRHGKIIAPDAHVLVVDDNRMNIRVIEGLLNEYKIKVTYATSGHEALDLIENMSYDFVFMDHMMPEMDGVETLHRIRNKVGHYYRTVPIIALTANAAPGNREMFLEEGFDDFLAKPVEVSVLERVLVRNLPEEKVIFQKIREASFSSENSSLISEDKVESSINQTDSIYKEEIDNEDMFSIADLDVSQGILYCGGKDTYLEIVSDCCLEVEEVCSELNDKYKKQDWTNYTIKVHALKSTMKSIGAMHVSDMAKELEIAGKKSDAEFISDNHGKLIEEYRRKMDEVSQSPFIFEMVQTDISNTGNVLEGNAHYDNGNMDESAVNNDMPEIDEETFDKLLTELEDAVYSFDEEQMLDILSELQKYIYHNIALNDRLIPVKKKVEMSDYMSAVDTVSQIRDGIKAETAGGTA